jgi:hypothetical protein
LVKKPMASSVRVSLSNKPSGKKRVPGLVKIGQILAHG